MFDNNALIPILLLYQINPSKLIEYSQLVLSYEKENNRDGRFWLY